MSGRPQNFTIDYNHPLAKGLVFAGLGASPGSTRYNDSSGKGNTGTLTNMEPKTDWVWSQELGRWCTNHNISSAKYVTYSFKQFESNSTFSVWLYPRTTGNSWGGIWNGNGYLSERSSSGMYFYKAGQTIDVTNCKPTGEWNLWTLVKDGAVKSLYRGTTLIATCGSYSWETGPHTIGWVKSNEYLDGLLADPVFHSRALTLPEIRILANRSDPMLSGLIRPIGSESNIYDREGIR